MRGVIAAAAIVLAVGPATAGEITAEKVRAALPKLDAIVADVLERTVVPGIAVAVVVGDEVIHVGGYGLRKAGTDEAVDADTIFQIASVSKPFASTAVAALVGDGTIAWNSRAADLDPGFRMVDPWVTSQVTLADMFSHRTGMPPQAGDLLEDLGFGRDEILHRFRYLEPTGGFRDSYAYTNFMLTAAGVAAAKAAGTTWEDLIQARVFAPLGMTRSSGREADFHAAGNRATIHFIEDGVATARFERRPDAQSPAGGVSSTARDMARWMVLQLNGGSFEGRQVVDAAALAETHLPHAVRGLSRDGSRAQFYGLGWNVDYGEDGAIRLSHAGAFFLGTRTEVTLLPADRFGIVVLTNAFPTGAPEAITNAFIDTLQFDAPRRDYLPLFEQAFAAMIPQRTYTPPAEPAPPMPAEAYAGHYANDYYGDAEVTDEGGALVLRLGPGKRPFALRHFDRDAFLFDFVGLGDEGEHPALASFASADGASADSLTIDFLNTHGQGTFARAAAQ